MGLRMTILDTLGFYTLKGHNAQKLKKIKNFLFNKAAISSSFPVLCVCSVGLAA